MEPAPPRDDVPPDVQALMRRARSPHLLQRPRMAELAATLAPALEAVPEVGSGTFGVTRPDVAAGPGSVPVMLPTGPRHATQERPAPPRPDDRAVAAAAVAEPPSLEARPSGPSTDAPQPAEDALLAATATAPATRASPPRWRGPVLAVATVILLAMLGVGVYLGVDALRQPSSAPPQASLTPFPSSSPSAVASPTPSAVASATPSGIPSATVSTTPSIVPATVPDVIGLSVERATERLEGAGFVVGTITSVPGPADTVVSSDPTPGEAVVSGTVVDLSVGDGSSG
jgi:serine/threonine-protein kinase